MTVCRVACTAGSRQLILCLVRPMHRLPTFAAALLIGVLSVASAAARDRDYASSIVGLWQGPQHVRVFYGDGKFFLDGEPEGRPLGRWKIFGDRLTIRAPQARAEFTERIIKLTRSEMVVVAADGKRYTYLLLASWSDKA